MSVFLSMLTILENEWSEIIELERGDFLCKKGDIHPYFYLVEKGSLHVYIEDSKEMHTFRFGYQNSIITPLDSFLTKKSTQFFIKAIKSTQLKRISTDRFLEIFSANEVHKNLWNEFLKEMIVGQLEREIDLITYTPMERFERLYKRSPHLFQEIPHKYIASYLRMKPETLSRLMNNFSKS